MFKKILFLVLELVFFSCLAEGRGYFESSYGEVLGCSSEQVCLWWCSSGWKVSRQRGLPAKKGAAIVIRAARNEAEAAQLVVRPSVPLKGFIAKCGSLRGPKEAVIGSENVEVLRVRYVNVTQPTDKSCVAGFWPDALPPFKGTIDLEAGKNQPLWIRVNVPKGTVAGTYRGTIKLEAEKYSVEVPLGLEVYDFTLPDRMSCTTAFGLDTRNVYRYHKLESIEQKRLVLDKYWASFSSHHISPYDPAPLDKFKVTWPKISDSTKPEELVPGFDWDAWDKAMERAIDHCHFNTFRLSIQGIGGGSFHGRREPKLLGYSEDSAHYKAAFKAYCAGLEEHLRCKGWLDEAYVYWFDEPEEKDYEFVMNGFNKLKSAAPGLRRMLTEQPEEGLLGGPNIWCPVSYEYREGAAQERQKFGEKFWWYVCCGPKTPYCTLFIDHPGTELRVWLWQTWKRGIEGILIWRVNYWTSSAAYPDLEHPQNPYEDPMGWRSSYSLKKGAKEPWGNGDGRFVYPPESCPDGKPKKPVLEGPVDSIRWEMLRDGIEDYEYMAILKRLLKGKRDKLSDRKYGGYAKLLEVPQTITKSMTDFTKNPVPIEKRRDTIAGAIEELSRL